MPNLNALVEADRRGILPPEQAGLLQEARRRGLIPSSPEATAVPEVNTQQGPPTQSPIGLGEVASGALKNLPGSAVQLASDVTAPLHSPKQTALGLGQMLRDPRPVAQFFAERYGGLENVKKTIRDDPAGFLADLGGIFAGGTSAAVKAGGTAGRIGSAARSVAVAPARAAVAGAGKVGSAAAEIFGLTTGAKAQPIKVAFEAGKAGGGRGQAFLQSIRGNVPMEQVVESARDALKTMNAAKMEAYRSGLGRVFSERPQGERRTRTVTTTRKSNITGPDGKPLTLKQTREVPVGEVDIAPVERSINAVLDAGSYKGVDISKSTAKMRGEIKAVLEEWKGLDPDEFHSVEGMDAMRKRIGDLVDSAPFNTPERRLANQAYFTVRKAIEDQAPGYAQVMRGYHEASKHLTDLEKALSLGQKAASETALRKLQAVMRNDVTAAFGKRAQYAKELERAGAGNLMETLAGQSLGSWTPRGLQSAVATTGGGAALLTGNPAALPLILGAGSPRAVGSAAFRGGQAHSALADLLSKIPRGSGHAMFQAGRAARAQ